MKDKFAPGITITLPSNTRVTHPDELLELVHYDDPATTAFPR